MNNVIPVFCVPDAVLSWEPSGEVRVDPIGYDTPLTYTSLGTYTHTHGNAWNINKGFAFIEAYLLVLRYKCDPHVVHSQMMKLAEYVDGMPDDLVSEQARDRANEMRIAYIKANRRAAARPSPNP